MSQPLVVRMMGGSYDGAKKSWVYFDTLAPATEPIMIVNAGLREGKPKFAADDVSGPSMWSALEDRVREQQEKLKSGESITSCLQYAVSDESKEFPWTRVQVINANFFMPKGSVFSKEDVDDKWIHLASTLFQFSHRLPSFLPSASLATIHYSDKVQVYLRGLFGNKCPDGIFSTTISKSFVEIENLFH